MADKRAYFKLDVGYMSNPKVLAVLDESSDAILLHIASIAYSAQHLTDGVVPVKALLRMTGATHDDADLLLAAGLWEPGPTGGEAEVHDYLEHQRSSAEAKGASEKAKRAASARWDASGNASSMPDAMPDASEPAMPREKREREEREKNKSAADAADAPKALALVIDDRPDVERLCDHLADRIAEDGSKRPEPGKGWHDAARLMLDKDGRTEQEIHAAIDWCQAHHFWRTNVLSMPKLREKFDQLRKVAVAEQQAKPGSRSAEWKAMQERQMARAVEREREMGLR